ncbi:unnamed protein product [Mucor hiemalis]
MGIRDRNNDNYDSFVSSGDGDGVNSTKLFKSGANFIETLESTESNQTPIYIRAHNYIA